MRESDARARSLARALSRARALSLPGLPASVPVRYAKFTLAGAVCCTTMHLAVVPIDVVKTKKQTDPAAFGELSIAEGAQVIARRASRASRKNARVGAERPLQPHDVLRGRGHRVPAERGPQLHPRREDARA